MASTISAGTTSATALVHTADTTGALEFKTNNGTTAVTIDTSQKVGVGTASPTQKVSIAGGLSFNSAISFSGSGYEIGQDGANFLCFSAGSAGTRFINASTATEFMRLDTSSNLQFNSGYGSVATAYGCRAWVNFNGTTSTPSTIRGSGNVTSVTKNGTGDYTINLTTAMPDTNGVVVGASVETIGAFTGGQRVVMPSFASTSTVRAGVTYQNGGAVDMPYVGISVFR